jgi:hypothetical protein
VSNDSSGSCDVETRDEDNIDRNFQLLIVMHGPGTIKWIRPFALLVPEDLSGDARACDDETGTRAVRYDGVGITADDYGDAVAGLIAKPLAHYTSTKTQILNQDGFQAAGVGTAESIVSQGAADRVADIIATRMAEFELGCLLPPIISLGLVDSPPPPSLLPDSQVVLVDGAGEFWKLVIDESGVFGMQPNSGPVTPDVILDGGFGKFCKLIVSTAGDRGTQRDSRPATSPPGLNDGYGSYWTMIANVQGDVGAHR